jgi:alpha-glucosidase
MRLILDWVPNHTSDQHPWFVEAGSGRDNPKRDWYVWRDGAPSGGPPNNWLAAFPPDSPAWTYHESTDQWYLHLFLPDQPDLNWDNPEVEDEMHDVLRFWLDRGIDGFRADVVHLIGKDPTLPSGPDEHGPALQVVFNDYESTHERLRRIRALLDGYEGDRMMVGEIILSTSQVATYYGNGDELHLVFNFTPLYAPWEAAAWRRRIDRVVELFDPLGAWPTWVLSNHDNQRHRTRLGSDARARAAAVLLLTLRGTPFLYAGEELGLADAVVPPDRVVDPGGRDGCRAPIPWSTEAGHGWPVEPWLPWPPDPAAHSVEALERDADSMLQLYRRLLAARRASPALHGGDFTFVDSPDGCLVYERASGDDRRLAAVNFTGDSIDLADRVAGTVEVSTLLGDEDRPFTGVLGPDQALIVRP